eukprot:s2345_g10.t1
MCAALSRRQQLALAVGQLLRRCHALWAPRASARLRAQSAMILISLSLAILVCGLELGRGGTFDSKRVLYVHARDGLEDKLEPDDIGACLALPVSTLRKATLTAISDILKKLGEVMDTSAEKGQERFLLFAALELTRAGVRLLDATYLRCCERLGCETCGLSRSAESEESSLTLLESFGRKAAALCHLVESSIALTTSTLEIRQREPPVIKRRSATQQVRHALQELLTADISVGLEALPPGDEALMNVGGVVGQTVRLIILQLLDAIPDMASEVRHLPKGVPAWSQLAAAEVLEASGASSATVQEMLFLLPLPAGWPATRASPLCEKRLLESSKRGRDQAQIAFARRDAAATTTWLGASPSQLLKIIATSGRPVHRSYVAIRQAGRFGQEASCEEAVGILYDPTLCLDDELGLSGVIYFLTMDPEIDDPLYVKWIGRAWSGQRSKEQPVWQSTMDPIMPPPDPYDLISLNPMAGNCQTIWQILQADSISTASIVYVPVNPTIPPPLEVMPNFTHFYIWHRRKSKAARRVGMDRFISNLQAFRRYIAAQCSLESVSKLLEPLGYELLYLEHFVAVLVHQRVASLVRQHLGQPGTTPSTFEVWRQGWYCSPYSRYMDHLEVGVGFDATWLNPEPSGPSEKGLGCSRSFREFLAAEGHLISGSYTGKDVCDEELQSTSRSMAMQAMHRRLRLLRGTATAGRGVASAEAMDMQPRAHAGWCIRSWKPAVSAPLRNLYRMSEEAIRNVVQELLEGGDLSEDSSPLLPFLIQGLRRSNVAVAEAAAQGLLALTSRSEGNRRVIKASSAASALKALHLFRRTELSALAEELSMELGDCTREQNHWLSFSFGRPVTLSLKVKLSEAREAEILSSHGWRVWPGAQLLTSWMVSEPSFLVGRKVLEVGAGPGLCGLAAAALGAQEVDLSDRCKAVQEALKMSAEESTNPHLLSKNGLAKKENGFKNATVRSLDWEAPDVLDRYDVALASEVIYQKPAVERLPKLLLEVLKPGGVFCACENAGRSQDGVRLLPLFFQEMEALGFYQLHFETKHFEGCDEEHALFKFGRNRCTKLRLPTFRVTYTFEDGQKGQHELQSACACLPPFRGSDCYIVDQGERDKERPFRGALVHVLDRRSETLELEAFLANLRKLNVLAGWEYPLIIFTAGVLPEQEKEKIILASENRVWFLQSQDAHIAGSGMLQWFRHTHLFDHPGIAGLDILWDLTDGDIAFTEDPLRNLHTKTAQAACRRIEDVSAHAGLRTSQAWCRFWKFESPLCMNIFVVKGPMTERPPNQVHGLCCLFDLGRSRSAQLRSIKGNQDLETFRAHTVLASEDLKKLVDQSFVWASVTKGNLDALLGDLTELFLQLSQASLAAEGVHGDVSACIVWKRTFMSEPLFRQYIQFLEDAVGGAAEAALRFDALSVRNFGMEMLHRQVRGSQLLMLG